LVPPLPSIAVRAVMDALAIKLRETLYRWKLVHHPRGQQELTRAELQPASTRRNESSGCSPSLYYFAAMKFHRRVLPYLVPCQLQKFSRVNAITREEAV